MNNFQLVVEELPELETEVGIAGSAKQQEVGGICCVGVMVIVIAHL